MKERKIRLSSKEVGALASTEQPNNKVSRLAIQISRRFGGADLKARIFFR